MATVAELRNEVRVAVGRFEREFDAPFTKEDLAAVCGAVGRDVDERRLPPKAEMRTAIRDAVTGLDGDADSDRAFRKAELETLAAALGGDD
jgi:hypothetical protein